MRLLVSCIPYDSGKSGISVYTREVVLELSRQGHELTLLCEPDGVDMCRGVRASCFVRNGWRLEPLGPGHSQETGNKLLKKAVFSMVWHLFALPLWVARRRGEFDGFIICAANRRVCAWYPVPTTATVHDLANFHIPGKYSRLRMFYLAHVLPFFAKRAQKLVAVSGATKTDMVKFWHCGDEDVSVLYNGLTFGKPFASGDGNGRGGGILYISRIEHPGKNHLRLIEAYGMLDRKVAEAHPLVIAGADWKDAEVVHAAAAASPHSDLIKFTGFVENNMMETLWSEAGFYVFPSLFEGFGLSLIEAMARGIPCACSGNGSLGEIAGDVAITFDPYSAESIANGLKILLSESESDRKDRIKRGFEHIKKFSWADHAAGLAKLLGGCK